MNLENIKSRITSGNTRVEFVAGGERDGIEMPDRIKVITKRFDRETGNETSEKENIITKSILEEKKDRYQKQADGATELLNKFPARGVK